MSDLSYLVTHNVNQSVYFRKNFSIDKAIGVANFVYLCLAKPHRVQFTYFTYKYYT